MTVLITRPGAHGSALCAQLAEHGIGAIHHPLIEMQPSPTLQGGAVALAQADIIIAVSQHAVTFAQRALTSQTLTWPSQATYLAVGQKTAHYLHKASQQTVNAPTISDSEHLLLLPELQNITGLRIVILRGNGGRELICQTLATRGAKVSYWETYQRRTLPFDPVHCLSQWQQHNVETLVITSGEQLSYFYQQLTPTARQWVSQRALLVPSERIAAIAYNLGFTQVTSIGSASNQDLLAALQPTRD